MKHILTVILLLSLVGCATFHAPMKAVENPELAWPKYRQRIQALADWQAHGVVGVSWPGNAQSANVSWVQSGSHFSLEFYGPLGIGATYIKGQPGQVTLITSKGKHLHANSAEALMQQSLGWSVPVEGLVYWVRGIPAPGAFVSYQLNRYGLLQQLSQSGWSITYANDTMVAPHIALPERMVLRQGNLRVVVVVHRWEV